MAQWRLMQRESTELSEEATMPCVDFDLITGRQRLGVQDVTEDAAGLERQHLVAVVRDVDPIVLLRQYGCERTGETTEAVLHRVSAITERSHLDRAIAHVIEGGTVVEADMHSLVAKRSEDERLVDADDSDRAM